MDVAIIGAGGQARVVYEILSCHPDYNVAAFVDNVIPKVPEIIMGIPVIGDHSVLPGLIKDGVSGAIIAIGDNATRAMRFEELRSLGFDMVSAIHPTAFIARNVSLGQGITVSIGAVINTNANIGDNAIINTNAIVEHEDKIGSHVHVGPGCAIAGRVTIKDGAFIGIGSVIKEYLTIGKNSIIGAGSVVLEDIPDNVIAVGTPAKVIKNRENNDGK